MTKYYKRLNLVSWIEKRNVKVVDKAHIICILSKFVISRCFLQSYLFALFDLVFLLISSAFLAQALQAISTTLLDLISAHLQPNSASSSVSVKISFQCFPKFNSVPFVFHQKDIII